MQEMTKLAVAGIAKFPQAHQPDATHPAEALLATSFASNPGAFDAEHWFLLRAGVNAVFTQAGHVAHSNIKAVSSAPPESKSFADSRCAGLIQNAIATNAHELLVDFLGHLNAKQLLLPRETIADALDVTDPKLRERLLPVLGERGRWLSQFRDEWKWVSEDHASLAKSDVASIKRSWDEGNIAQRLTALRSIRASDPAEGRRWLLEGLDNDKPEHRAQLVAACEVGLSVEDQEWLEARLSDRSEQVRTAVATLLSLLPESALAARMRERARTMIEVASGLLSLKLTCTPPEEIDKSWTRDGIPAKPPAGRGKRAVWLEAVLSLVPPSYWSQEFKKQPEALLTAARKDDFAIPLLTGWTMAAVKFASRDSESQDWLLPLWEEWQHLLGKSGNEKIRLPIEPFGELLSVIPSSDAETIIGKLLADQGTHASSQTLSFLTQLAKPWSESFAELVLKLARKSLSQHIDSGEYRWATALFTIARAIPGSLFESALQPWNVAQDSRVSHIYEREVDRFIEAVQARNLFYQVAVAEE